LLKDKTYTEDQIIKNEEREEDEDARLHTRRLHPKDEQTHTKHN